MLATEPRRLDSRIPWYRSKPGTRACLLGNETNYSVTPSGQYVSKVKEREREKGDREIDRDAEEEKLRGNVGGYKRAKKCS